MDKKNTRWLNRTSGFIFSVPLICSLLFSLLLSANAAANPQPSHNQIFMCNSVIKSGDAACSDYDTAYITGVADLLIGPQDNSECDQNPTDPSCGGTTPTANSVGIAVINAQSGAAEYYIATRDTLDNVSVTPTSTPSTIGEIADDIAQIDALHRVLLDELTLDEASLGQFVNNNNEHINQVAGQPSAYTNNATSAACPSAIAYRTVDACGSLFNNLIHSVHQNNSNINALHSAITSLSTSLLNVTISFDTSNFTKIPAVFRFNDGSKLVLTVTATSTGPGIEVDEIESYTVNKTTFKEYFRDNGPSGIASNGSTRVSGGEASALFGNWAWCQKVAQTLAKDKEYLVTFKTQPDRASYVSAYEITNSTPDPSGKTTCMTMPARQSLHNNT
ncbi:hypothetical protein [Alteromonas gilva]|uniref:Uncharacterized protein n=1 Tax=Alteromonas gilva TaxID=2987522 RepID=A0ABT5L6N8_9ALTE|nr:hypothetical protein [Alteromonas gilva]MDC8832151.1 hypothetical protein [Alteromonas gilva]